LLSNCIQRLHIGDIAHVVNYNVPKMAYFIHCIGRTGSAGLQGCASTLASRTLPALPEEVFV
jgi:superfamily II DNA/RNA helicase